MSDEEDEIDRWKRKRDEERNARFQKEFNQMIEGMNDRLENEFRQGRSATIIFRELESKSRSGSDYNRSIQEMLKNRWRRRALDEQI